jgi:hypothetical protein
MKKEKKKRSKEELLENVVSIIKLKCYTSDMERLSTFYNQNCSIIYSPQLKCGL